MKIENKINEQSKAIKSWVNNNYLGTINAVTGFGKCKVGLDAINLVYNQAIEAKANIDKFSILIVTPTTEIKKEWVKEFKKWKMLHILKHVDIQCVNTCSKYNNRSYSIGIFDEVHNYLGNTFYNVFKNNNFKRKICLSASIPSEHFHQLFIEQKCPIIYKMNIDKALELELINNFKVYNIGVHLTKAENRRYTFLTNKINEASLKGYNAWDLIGQRKNLVYDASSKYKLLEDIKQYFNSYGIIFTQSKKSVERVKDIVDNCLVHHSGLTPKKRTEVIKLFSDGRTKEKILSSAMTLDEGVTLPRLQFAIILANTSKEKQFIQRTGRVVRLEENKKESIIIRIYCKNTVEENWIKKSQDKVKNIYINKNKIDTLWT
jgi:superfamily II DNA or RNA helicase